MKVFRLFILLLILIGGGLFFSSEFNREAVFRTSGMVESGQKFGIHIGMSISDVSTYLESKGFRASIEKDRDICLGVKPGADEKVVSWLDWDWHRGRICVFSKNGSVSQIRWKFGYFI